MCLIYVYYFHDRTLEEGKKKKKHINIKFCIYEFIIINNKLFMN